MHRTARCASTAENMGGCILVNDTYALMAAWILVAAHMRLSAEGSTMHSLRLPASLWLTSAMSDKSSRLDRWDPHVTTTILFILSMPLDLSNQPAVKWSISRVVTWHPRLRTRFRPLLR